MDRPGVEHVFVYGTLRRGHAHAMSRWLAEQGQWLGLACCEGALYRVASTYPGLVANKAGQVWGEIYQLSAANSAAALAKLDAYEELGSGEYERVQRTVYLATGDTVRAWVYVYCRTVSEVCRIDSGDFFRS